MNTVATRAEMIDSQPVDCLAAQRRLAHAAGELMRRLPLRAENAIDLLRLGAACVAMAAEQAFGARTEREAVVGWTQCELGERQIRAATYRALRAGFIRNRDYDAMFNISTQARRARNDELQRLRRRLRLLSVI
jgi:hypothetical protein